MLKALIRDIVSYSVPKKQQYYTMAMHQSRPLCKSHPFDGWLLTFHRWACDDETEEGFSLLAFKGSTHQIWSNVLRNEGVYLHMKMIARALSIEKIKQQEQSNLPQNGNIVHWMKFCWGKYSLQLANWQHKIKIVILTYVHVSANHFC